MKNTDLKTQLRNAHLILLVTVAVTIFTILPSSKKDAYAEGSHGHAAELSQSAEKTEPTEVSVETEKVFPEPETTETDFGPHEFRIYTHNSLFSEATITLKTGGETFVRKMPEVNGLHRELIDYGKGSGEVVFEGVRPEWGFYLKVEDKDGNVIAAWSQQPLKTKSAFRSAYLHVCYGPHLYVQGSHEEFGLWPIGHESYPITVAAHDSQRSHKHFALRW